MHNDVMRTRLAPGEVSENRLEAVIRLELVSVVRGCWQLLLSSDARPFKQDVMLVVFKV